MITRHGSGRKKEGLKKTEMKRRVGKTRAYETARKKTQNGMHAEVEK